MRILFVQPSLQPPGGGNGVAAWMIQALREEHELTVLTWAKTSLDEINRHFGTDLQASDAVFVQAYPVLASTLVHLRTPFDLLKSALLMRAGREKSADFDLAIGCNNEADLGERGLQYIHYPRYLRPRPDTDLRWFHIPALLRIYYRLADAVSGISFDRMRGNRTLVNSDWTGRLVKTLHGIESTTLHPPVVSQGIPVDWSVREDAFLCLGRIAPEKELEKVIAIVEKVRQRGHEVTLTIAGGTGPRDYMRDIEARVRSRAGWVRMVLDATRDALNDLIARHRYGIHGMREEHFGMAPAELIAAGCIVFLPAGGGQKEIVDSDSRFLYASLDDAVDKIERMLDSPPLQAAAREALRGGVARYSTGSFAARFRSIVNEAKGRSA